jgi:hypothetical protein
MRKSVTLCSISSLSHPRKTRRKTSFNNIDRHGESPSEYTIRNILNYSLALSVIQTKDTGCVNLVMN